jgi:hypothetical protein
MDARSGTAAALTLDALTSNALAAVLVGGELPASVVRDAAEVPGGAPFLRALSRPRREDRPDHYESGCGLVVTGARVREAVSCAARVDLLSGAEGLVRIWDLVGPAASVLVVLADGRGTLLPVIPGFLTTLEIEDGDLAGVAWEPASTTARGQAILPYLARLRGLRGIAAAATRLGALRLEPEAAAALALEVRTPLGLDLALAVYTAYALHDLQRMGEIEDIARAVHGELGMHLLDLVMLAGRPPSPGAPRLMPPDVYPAVPLLAPGWALLEACGMRLPVSLAALRRHVTGSLWTLLDEEGVAAVRTAIDAGEVR